MKKTAMPSGVLIGLLSMVIFLGTAVHGNATSMIESSVIHGYQISQSSITWEHEINDLDPEKITSATLFLTHSGNIPGNFKSWYFNNQKLSNSNGNGKSLVEEKFDIDIDSFDNIYPGNEIRLFFELEQKEKPGEGNGNGPQYFEFDLSESIVKIEYNGISMDPGKGKVPHSQNPEPATFILFGIGLLGAAGISRRSFSVKR